MPRSLQFPAARLPRRLALSLLGLALAGCAAPPQMETPPAVRPGMESHPRLVPLEEILAVAPPEDAAARAQDAAAFDARVAALRMRAARLRQHVPDD